jgi:hypothetical protein
LWYQLATQTRISFESTAATGLQLMRVQESQALDFEIVFMIGMNESNFPGRGNTDSFLPYHLRKAFNLPTIRELLAAGAYQFYRLLHRSKRIVIFYDNEPESEPSRFVLQLQYMPPENIPVIFRSAAPLLKHDPIIPAVIYKRRGTLDRLAHWRSASAEIPAAEYISHSFLASYIKNPFHFFIERIARSYPIPEPGETTDDATFLGNVVHEVLHKLYSTHLLGAGKFEVQQLDSCRAVLDSFVERAIADIRGKQLPEPVSELKGIYRLYYTAAKRLVEGMLKKDQTAALNKAISMIMALEDTYNINFKIDDFFVTLSAKFDRVHQTSDGKIVIVDYKTGELKKLATEKLNPRCDKKYDPEHYFELLFTNPDYSHSLQSWLYVYIYYLSQKGHVGAETALPNAVFYVLKKQEQNLETTFDLEAIEQEAGVKQGYYLQQFEAMLIKKIKEIFDPAVPFREIIRPAKSF